MTKEYETRKKVLNLLLDGMSNDEIKKELGLSISTVKYHVNNLILYYQAKSRLDLVCKIYKENKREWQNLTDDEIKEIVGPWGDTPIKGYTRKLFDQIEAKLKEKNT